MILILRPEIQIQTKFHKVNKNTFTFANKSKSLFFPKIYHYITIFLSHELSLFETRITENYIINNIKQTFKCILFVQVSRTS